MLTVMFCMTILTTIIGLIAVKTRLSLIKSNELDKNAMRLMKQQELPDRVILTSRCFNNMFEIPTLFYAVSILYIVQHVETGYSLIIAWIFFGARCLQAIVHLTSNNVRLRMLAYFVSIVSVMALWVNLVI